MFIIPDPKAAKHKTWLYRVLEAIAGDPSLVAVLYFKGGTCASMLGWLNRFSVDLDFDFSGTKDDVPVVRKKLEKIFSDLRLEISDSSKNGIQYFLKYDNPPPARNTLKIDVSFPLPQTNTYASQRFVEIDRVLTCQTRETMFANKLIAVMGRHEKNGEIAGRDIFDIHHFFMSGYSYSSAVIRELTGMDPKAFLEKLAHFIEKEVTQEMIDQDLNSLLTPQEFARMRRILKRETMVLMRDEVGRL